MVYTCPSCKKEKTLDLDFKVDSYICDACSMLSEHEKIIKTVKKPTENVVLDVGKKGKIDDVEYTVVAIVVKKYGESVYWREYYLKDKDLNDAFLSESSGHWVFMQPKEMPEKEFKFHAEFEGKKYRWYESTPNSIHAATGFFEEQLKFTLANYKEFVNGTEMVSWEESGTKRTFSWEDTSQNMKLKGSFNQIICPTIQGLALFSLTI